MKCKNCGTEYEGYVCPNGCDKNDPPKKIKKPLYKKWWFWVLMGIATIVLIASIGGNSEPTTQPETPPSSTTETTTETEPETPKEEEKVTYEVVDIQTMLDELDANALKAEKTYQDKNVELVGKISNFDSDGNYVSIEPLHADEWNFDNVQCYIKDDAQLDLLLEKKVGDKITVRGKITSIGEILGYSLNIEEIV